MTPIRQGPLSDGPDGFVAVLVFGACFLAAAGLITGAAWVAAGAGWAFNHAGAARHNSTNATAMRRTMKNSGGIGAALRMFGGVVANI
jgi:hypothetical protein